YRKMNPLGYSMELKWPNNTISGKIALIADEFFDINDIKINGGKSEVIVVNLEDNNENERFIEIGKNRNKVTANKVESEEWNISIIGPNVRNFIYQQASELQKKDKEFIIRKAATLSIYGALQLLNHDALNTISWQQICNINKRQAR
ncbi:9331_t:CDS:2, partial [Rhizophagus irregularis]